MSSHQLSLPPLLDVPELLQLQRQSAMGVTDLCLFDCRTEPGPGAPALELPFIPGARLLDHHPHLKTPNPEGKPGLFIMPPEEFTAWASRRGIGKNSHVVAYDHAKGVSASRLWWSLRFYGHSRVQVLNGGMRQWEAAGERVVSEPTEATPKSFEAAHIPALVADHAQISNRPAQVQVMDVRTPGEWDGEDLRGNPRGGHIPGACHFPFDQAVGADNRWRPAQEIKALLLESGVPEDAGLISHCQAGIRASHFALSATLAGWQDVRVYDGSFKDYSRRDTLPLE